MSQAPAPDPSARRRFVLRGGLFGAAVLEFALFFYEGLLGIAGSFEASVMRAIVFFIIFAAIAWVMSGTSKQRNKEK